jgi:DnaK suppressor protein
MQHDSIDPKHFRRLLLNLQQELQAIESTGQAAAETVELDQTKMGRLSRMDAMQAQAMSKATNLRRAATLRGIEAALQRIERGGYGECMECGENINPKRLEFDPTVRLCIQCAEQLND